MVRVERAFPGERGPLRHCGSAVFRDRCHKTDLCGTCRRRVEAMKINAQKCVACGNCTYVCPMGAIYIDPIIKRATIDSKECVECYACFNGMSQEHLNPTLVRALRKTFQFFRLRFDPEPDVCPTAAFE